MDDQLYIPRRVRDVYTNPNFYYYMVVPSEVVHIPVRFQSQFDSWFIRGGIPYQEYRISIHFFLEDNSQYFPHDSPRLSVIYLGAHLNRLKSTLQLNRKR